MKLTKSELRKMIRECLREELTNNANLQEGGFTDAVKGLFGKKKEATPASADIHDTIEAADKLLAELAEESGNYFYDEIDSGWSPNYERGHVWVTRYIYPEREKLQGVNALRALCAKYSKKLPNVRFYYFEDSYSEDSASEIGYEAVNVNYGIDDMEEQAKSVTSSQQDALAEGAVGGGYAGDNSFSGGTVRGRGASTQPSKKSYLTRLKSNNPELVDIMTIKGKDIKPGMITQAGQVKQAEVKARGMYIMHTNNYDGFWGVDDDMEVMVDPDDKSKPFTGDYKALLKRGLKESLSVDNIFENLY